jgi:hypothetical protein
VLNRALMATHVDLRFGFLNRVSQVRILPSALTNVVLRVMLDTPASPDALTRQLGAGASPAARFVVFERVVVGDYRARSCVNAESEHVRSVIVTDGVEHPSSGVDGR